MIELRTDHDGTRPAVGLDGRKFPQAAELGPLGLLERCVELGYDGVFFRTILDVTPRLDTGVLADVRDFAQEHSLYIEMGLGKVNPYNTSEDRSIRSVGGGDYLLGMTRMIEAATAVGCTALWADTANYQGHEWGLQANDRFRTDTTWQEQLRATTAYLGRLAPVLRSHGAVIAIETHEEITTQEISDIADAVGEDIVGVTLDLANVVVRGEDPIEATARVASLVRKTHIRDVALFRTPHGIRRQIRACGDGVIDWPAVLRMLHSSSHRVNLTIENATAKDHNDIPCFDKDWLAGQPELRTPELLRLLQLANEFEDAVANGERPGSDDYYTDPYPRESQEAFITRCKLSLTEAWHTFDPR